MKNEQEIVDEITEAVANLNKLKKEAEEMGLDVSINSYRLLDKRCKVSVRITRTVEYGRTD